MTKTADKVLMTLSDVTTTPTSPVVGAAIAGNQTFAEAGYVDNETAFVEFARISPVDSGPERANNFAVYECKYVAGALEFVGDPISSSNGGSAITLSLDHVVFTVNPAVKVQQSHELLAEFQADPVIGGITTGGLLAKGPGSIHAKSIHDDGVMIFDAVFEQYFTGETKERLPENYKFLNLDEEVQFIRENYHFSSMIGRSDWDDQKKNTPNHEILNGMWVTLEHLLLHIKELNDRISVLEGK